MKIFLLFFTGIMIPIFSSGQLHGNVKNPHERDLTNSKVSAYRHGRDNFSSTFNYYTLNYSNELYCPNFIDHLYVWPINSAYAIADSNFVKAGVSFKDWIDIDCNFLTPSFPIVLDTLQLQLTHENNTGQNDTLILYVSDVNQATGFPIGQILWSDTLITNNSLSPSGNWSGVPNCIFDWTVTPGIFLTGIFFAGFEYHGSTLDSCGIIGGFQGFYPNVTEADYGKTYRQYSQYPSSGWFPDLSGYDLYNDWNGNNIYDIGTGEAQPLQTIALSAIIHEGGSLISGYVYNDLNGNGIKEAGEAGIPNEMVTDGQFSCISDVSGLYRLFVDSGSHSVQHPIQGYYTSTPANYTVNVSATGQTFSGNDFALNLTSNVQDLQITVTDISRPRPGFYYNSRITYKNHGTIPMTGSLGLTHDAQINYINSNPPPASYSANTGQWNFSNLQPFEQRNISVSFYCPPSQMIGTGILDSAWILPVLNDSVALDNSYVLNDTVIGSYDPNDKSVEPAGSGVQGKILVSQKLTYTIRFQNTGNYPASFIIVKDTLDSNLDMSTFAMLSSSHDYNYEIHDNNIITWTFNNIMLPDSNSNEAESHGFIKYSIKPKATLAVGTQIHNTAFIYFDFNAPVVTNTTLNTISLLTSNQELPSQSLLNSCFVFPNPATENIEIEFLKGQSTINKIYDINFYNLLGEKILHRSVFGEGKKLIDVSSFPSGVYLIKLKDEKNNSLTIKLVKI